MRRTVPSTMRAKRRRSASPALWPSVSLTRLKSSRSMSSRASGRRSRAAACRPCSNASRMHAAGEAGQAVDRHWPPPPGSAAQGPLAPRPSRGARRRTAAHRPCPGQEEHHEDHGPERRGREAVGWRDRGGRRRRGRAEGVEGDRQEDGAADRVAGDRAADAGRDRELVVAIGGHERGRHGGRPDGRQRLGGLTGRYGAHPGAGPYEVRPAGRVAEGEADGGRAGRREGVLQGRDGALGRGRARLRRDDLGGTGVAGHGKRGGAGLVETASHRAPARRALRPGAAPRRTRAEGRQDADGHHEGHQYGGEHGQAEARGERAQGRPAGGCCGRDAGGRAIAVHTCRTAASLRSAGCASWRPPFVARRGPPAYSPMVRGRIRPGLATPRSGSME